MTPSSSAVGWQQQQQHDDSKGVRRTRTREQADVWGARQDEVEESPNKDISEVEIIKAKKEETESEREEEAAPLCSFYEPWAKGRAKTG